MERSYIKNGAFIVARKLFKSEIWLNKPSSWKVIWIYILGNVSHEDNEICDRGEGFFQWKSEINNVGYDITPDMIKKFIKFAKGGTGVAPMISTERSTRGMYIKVLKYNTYQTFDNYKSTDKSTKKALEKHPDIQEVKNVKKEDIATTLHGTEWNTLIDSFKEINPSYLDFYNNTTERKALDVMAKQWGYDKLLRTIQELPKIIGLPYAPKITKPTELRRDIGKLLAYHSQEKLKTKTNSRQIL